MMLLVDTVAVLNRARKVTFLIAAPVLAIMLTGCDAGAESSKSSVDASLLRAERVDERLALPQALIRNAASARRDDKNADIAKTEPLLISASEKAFDAGEMRKKILVSIEATPGQYADVAAFDTATAALADGYRAVDKMYADKDEDFGKKIETRLASPEVKSTIEEVANLMASPDLAAETAVTQQAISAVLTMETGSPALDPSSEEYKQLKATLPSLLPEFRNRPDQGGAYSKESAKAFETAGLTFALATLTDKDLSALKSFYAGSYGKSKRQELLVAYQQVWDAAATTMLTTYIEELAKQHPAALKAQ